MARGNILTERSHSDNNILQHSSFQPTTGSIIQHRSPAKNHSNADSQTRRMSRSSTVSSPRSVLRDGTTNRKSLSSSPPKQRQSHATPDWKQLVMGEDQGLGGGKDLFSPIGLENIFSRPIQGSFRKSPGALSFWQDMDSVPSSPPPWTSNRRPSNKSIRQAVSQRCKQTLGILSEQEEGEQGRNSISEEFNDDLPLPQEFNTEIYNNAEHDMSNESIPIDEHDAPSQLNSEKVPNSQILVGSITTPASKYERPLIDELRSDDANGHPKSSSSIAFSPVFISKRNTIDGKVDYVPLDLSNIQLAEHLQRLSVHTSNFDDPSAMDQPNRYTSADYRTASLPSPRHSDHLSDVVVPPISGFVSVERGGQSEYGSFKRKPLSPWESCSVGPSDSISQVYALQVDEQSMQSVQEPPTARISDTQNLPKDSEARNARYRRCQDLNDLHDVKQIRSYSTTARSSNDTSYEPAAPRTDSIDTVVHQSPNASNRMRRTGSFTKLQSPSAETVVGVKECAIDRNVILNADGAFLDFDDQLVGKRPASLVMAQSSPKRQRTYGQLDFAVMQEHISDATLTQHRRLQAAAADIRNDSSLVRGQDTKDSVVGSQSSATQTLIRKHTSQGSIPSDRRQLSHTAINEELSNVYDHIDRIVVPCDASEAAQIKAVAAEVATFRLKSVARLQDSNRKQSVSTKDYVDEAMKIMDLIRSKRRPQSIMSSLEDHDSENSPDWDFDNLGVVSPQTISRPPSRDGALNAWRTRNGRSLADPRILSQLRKYQETGDESFLTSAFHDDETLDEDDDEAFSEPEIESDMINVRISPPITTENLRRISTPTALNINGEAAESQVRTNSSGGSNSNTHKTNSSQTTRTVPIIGAQSVALPEVVGGMRFDAEKHVWVKHVEHEAMPQDARCDSEDPFDDITDFSVHEDEPPRETGNVEVHAHSSQLETRTGSQEEHETQEIPSAPRTDGLIIPTPGPSVKRRQQLLSVAFSSPPTFHHAPIYRWKDGSELSAVQDEPEDIENTLSDESEPPQIIPRHRNSSLACFTPRVGSRQRQLSLRNQLLGRSVSVARMEEHREVSLIQTRPDGRTMSLTLSISTPLPMRHRSHGQVVPASGQFNQQSPHSLSPLSDFTIHQDDGRHLQSQRLLSAEQSAALGAPSYAAAHVVSNLVERLADTEPDEPYWDWMHVLDLAEKGLDSLHTLNEFCPRIEQLNVSNNKLSHLDGVPPTLRQLYAQCNRLSGLTNWTHLQSLQYLDVSGNELDSLEGLANLVHLRELRADDNQITSIKGLLDLDGLLSLSLQRNRLASLDLCDAGFTRLTNLDISDNSLVDVRGLHYLPELICLDISNNKLQNFPQLDNDTSQIRRLEVLRCANNMLDHLDVSHTPNLRVLHADHNRLDTVASVGNHAKLQTMYLREQAPEMGPRLAARINDFCELRNLYLSGNNLSSLPITSHFLNLQTLELAFAGLQSLPPKFSKHAPNLRTLNLNSNSLKDLRALRGVVKLRHLYMAGNRLTRLRKTISVVESFGPSLEVLDLRDNPFSQGFYAAPSSSTSTGGAVAAALALPTTNVAPVDRDVEQPQHLLPAADAAKDAQHVERLDEDTRLRRRVYELLLATKCVRLSAVDGLGFTTDKAVRQDKTWERLLKLGVVEKAAAAEKAPGDASGGRP